MKALLAAGVMLLMAYQAHAEKWPEHGFFWVQDGVEQSGRYCDLRAELKIRGAIFALAIRENPSGSLITVFLNQAPSIRNADETIVSIDGRAIFRFMAQVRDRSPKLPGMAAFFNRIQGTAIIGQLREAAKGARWLQVTASPYANAVPADGLSDALEDLVACHSRAGT